MRLLGLNIDNFKLGWVRYLPADPVLNPKWIVPVLWRRARG